MRQIFFTPGPSQIYSTVGDHIKTALKENIFSISHRSERFQAIFRKAKDGLRTLLAIPKDYHIVFVASGTEAMERIIENTVEKKSLHFVNGSFAKRWYEIAVELGKTPEKYEVPFGEGFHTSPVVPKDVELICFNHNETSSGVAIDPKFIYNVAKNNHNALIAVDTVSSVPYVDLDYKKLDCTFFSVQKLFGLPAGLGCIILSPRAIEKAKFLQTYGISIGSYHSFPTLVEWAEKNQTLETPNVFGILLLGKVIMDMQKIGIKMIRKDTAEKARLMYSFLEQHQKYKIFVSKEYRSTTVIVAEVGDAKSVLARLKKKGMIVGGGYGPYKEKQIRIANFPAVNKKDIERLLSYL